MTESKKQGFTLRSIGTCIGLVADRDDGKVLLGSNDIGREDVVEFIEGEEPQEGDILICFPEDRFMLGRNPDKLTLDEQKVKIAKEYESDPNYDVRFAIGTLTTTFKGNVVDGPRVVNIKIERKRNV